MKADGVDEENDTTKAKRYWFTKFGPFEFGEVAY